MSHFNNPHGSLCIVQGCANGIQSNPSIQYFAVPAHIANVATAWYKNTMRTDLRPSHTHRVCEQHFEESCFDYVGNGTKVLKPKSLPTLFDLEVFYKMIAYQESNKTIKKTNITFHTSNPDIDGKTLEPILKMNLDSDHVKTRLAPTMSTGHSQQDEKEPQAATIKSTFNHTDHFENKASNRCHVEGCVHNYVARRHRVQLYKISRDPAIARKWLDACGYENIPVSQSTSTFKVCREHFTPNDFEGPATLRYDAVPSLFTFHSRSLMDKQSPSGAKRFRADITNHRTKQSTPIVQNKRVAIQYRNSNMYVRQDGEQNSIIPQSPIQENFDENFAQMITDTKQIFDIDLNMNCIEEQLSEAQLGHNPVKALDRTETPNGLVPKARNPVGRPRIHPRHPTPPTIPHRPNHIDDDIEEIESWNDNKINRKSEREWTNGQQDHRLPWSKKTTTMTTPSTYRDIRQQRPINSTQEMTMRKPNVPYSHDQGISRIKPVVVRNRAEGLSAELEQTYKRSLSKYYGQKPGRNLPLSDYGDYRCRCPLCNDVILENNIQLIIHLNQHVHYQRNTNTSSTSSSSTQSPFEQINTKCSYCHSEFSNPYFLAMHIDDKHLNDINEYSCRICEENHSTLLELVEHLNSFHGGLDMPYSCQVCSFRTSIYTDMIYHIDEVHKGTRYFFCSYCFEAIELPLISTTSSAFLNGNAAYKHLLMHQHQERSIPSKFQHCRRCLLHVSSMKDHLQRDHANISDGNKSTSRYYHKNNDESEVYDDSMMDTSSMRRLVTPTKNG